MMEKTKVARKTCFSEGMTVANPELKGTVMRNAESN